MENNSTQEKKTTFSSVIKNVFFLLLILQFLPSIFSNFRKHIMKSIKPKTEVGRLNISGAIVSSDFYVKQIKKFLKNDDIKALLVKVESPGGVPGSSQIVFEELKKFRKHKPVVVLVENICASGAYYIASAADKIIAPASSMVGSIGVYLQLPNFKELAEKWNIKFKFIKSGKFKTTGNPLKDLTAEEERYLQNLADENYYQFIKDVSDARGIDINENEIWANGKVFLASQAKEINLVDQIGTLTDAENVIKELAAIKTEIKFVTPKKATGLMKFFNPDADDAEQSLASNIAVFVHDTYLNLKTVFNLS